MKKKKTLMLCFIHGFKGGDATFGDDGGFTRDVGAAVARRLRRVEVRVLVYPRYETRGDLGQCVSRFRDWLEEKTIDAEVAAGTAAPTIDGAVRTVLVGHSMGGIVAGEAALELGEGDGGGFMFPFVQGVLGLDTPFLGIAPGVVAHGAEGHYQSYQSAVAQLDGLWGGGGGGSASSAPASSAWGGRWAKAAVLAGVAAGGAAAWANRERLTGGWAWAASHLEFVGCLGRGEELRARVRRLQQLRGARGVGFANLYTRLGAAAAATGASVARGLVGADRTFCNVPRGDAAGEWRAHVNDRAGDETRAHTTMFEPAENPGYARLVEDAAELIAGWVDSEWYGSSGGADEGEGEGEGGGGEPAAETA